MPCVPVRHSGAIRAPQPAGARGLSSSAAPHRTRRHLALRVLADIVAGASAGGINSVLPGTGHPFGSVARAVDRAVAGNAPMSTCCSIPMAQPWSRAWRSSGRRPLIAYLLRAARQCRQRQRRARNPGRSAPETVPPHPLTLVRAALQRRSHFPSLMRSAFAAMAASTPGPPLLPRRPSARPVRHRHRLQGPSGNPAPAFAQPGAGKRASAVHRLSQGNAERKAEAIWRRSPNWFSLPGPRELSRAPFRRLQMGEIDQLVAAQGDGLARARCLPAARSCQNTPAAANSTRSR